MQSNTPTPTAQGRSASDKSNGPDSAIVFVEDDGIGYSGVPAPGSTGLGQRIVKAMAEKLGSSVHHETGRRGTKIEIAFATLRKPVPGSATPIAT